MSGKVLKASLIGTLLLPLLSGCASIVSGSHQTIKISTNPAGAKCSVYRDGMEIGSVQSTPGTVTVHRRSGDIIVGCIKQNYDFSKKENASDLNGWVIGNIGFGGLIGLVVDLSTGANHAYDHKMKITLTPLPEGVAPPTGLPDIYPGPITRAAQPENSPVATLPGALLPDHVNVKAVTPDAKTKITP